MVISYAPKVNGMELSEINIAIKQYKKMKPILITILLVCSFSTFSQEKLKGEGEMPILAWTFIPETEASVERYLELKESGINMGILEYSNISAVENALNTAQKAGIKIITACPELKTETEKTVKRLMKHPALAGYYLADEPVEKDFAELGEWTKRIQATDKIHDCYINLYPNWAGALEGKSYRKYVESFVEQVPVPMLSFDNYPIRELADGRLVVKNDWYENLEVIRDVAQKTNLPVWAFAMTTAHLHRDYLYPVPTIAQLRLQMFSNLAYGAQALQYFTYWTPTWREFYRGPLTVTGKRTEIYDRIKVVNQEIQNLSGVFLGAKVVSVWHTGDWIPAGTLRMGQLPVPIKELETSDGGAIVSVLEKNNSRYLVIVNRDFQKPMKLTVVADDFVKKVLKDGTLVPANAYIHTMEVDPGDMAIYAWNLNP
jgi:hypothetical protein